MRELLVLVALSDFFVSKTSRRKVYVIVVLVAGDERDRVLRFARSDVIEAPYLVSLGLATLSKVAA